jgi:heme/copper-type cytochrome/quinol oxidase subunit 1
MAQFDPLSVPTPALDFPLGAIVANLGWVWGGLANDGWFNYANLSERFYSPGLNLDFYDIGLLILGTSTIMGALNLFVTIVNLRAPGMTFFRMPTSPTAPS